MRNDEVLIWKKKKCNTGKQLFKGIHLNIDKQKKM